MKTLSLLLRSLFVWVTLIAGPSVLFAQYNIASTNPTSFLSGVTADQTLTVTGTLPTSLSTSGVGNYSYCFYTGYGASATPLVPGTANSTTETLTIPASSINSIPLSAFTFGSVFQASLYVIADPSGSATCSAGQATASNTQNVIIVYSPSGSGGVTITLTPTTLPNGKYGTAYSQTLTASGGTAPYNYAVNNGNLPAGLQLNGATGVISGTPTASGSYSFTITAVDANSNLGSQPYTLTVGKATLTVTATSASRAYGAANPTFTGTYTGAVNGDTFTVSGTSSATTASAPGTYSIVPTATGTNLANYTVTPVNGTLTVGKAQPTIQWATPAAIVIGTPLSSVQLNATASDPNGSVPGQFTYSPAAGAVLPTGAGETLAASFVPTDATDYANATGSTSITVIPLAISQITPTSIPLGAAATTVTVVGTGFLPNSVVEVNGKAAPTVYISSTQITATVASSLLQTVQPLNITVFDPTQSETSNAVSAQIIAPTLTASFSGPSTVDPAQQPPLTFTLTSAYPLPLTGTLTLTFAGTGGVDDPSIQFATGGRTQTFTVPANSTTAPTILIQSGTVAGTITVTLTLTAGGQDVTPSSITPVNITVPSSAPGLTNVSVTRSGNTLTASIIGFSNTREVSTAIFHFTPAPGATITDMDVSVPVSQPFAGWFGSSTSTQYGSSFNYTQEFSVSGGASQVGTTTVTLTNSTGSSVPTTAN